MQTLILAALLSGTGEIFADGFEEPMTADCPAIEGFSRTPRVLIENLGRYAATYEELFGRWGAGSNTLHVRMEWPYYASLPFTIGSDRADDNANIIWELIDENPEWVRISVSACQGPPTPESAVPQTGNDRCYIVSNGSIGGFSMTLAGKQSGSIECVLEPGSYYFNFGWIDAEGKRACKAPTCVWNVKEQ